MMEAMKQKMDEEKAKLEEDLKNKQKELEDMNASGNDDAAKRAELEEQIKKEREQGS